MSSGSPSSNLTRFRIGVATSGRVVIPIVWIELVDALINEASSIFLIIPRQIIIKGYTVGKILRYWYLNFECGSIKVP